MARYLIRARNGGGLVAFPERLTLAAALAMATELRAARFHRITLVNTETGVEITDLEELAAAAPLQSPPDRELE